MSTPANALDITQAGLVKFDGINAFTGVSVTNHDVLIGSTSNGITSVGPGSAGQILQSGGASADPSYSTATYPSTSGTSGNVLVSDGTNWVSTATTSVGLFQQTSITLTSAQIKSLRATPIQIIAAPGSGKGICIVNATAKFNYGGTNVFVAAASQKIDLYFANNLTAAIGLANGLVPNTAIVATNNKYSKIVGEGTASFNGVNPGIIENTNIAAYQSGSATEISGNAANDNTITITIVYYIVTF